MERVLGDFGKKESVEYFEGVGEFGSKVNLSIVFGVNKVFWAF